MKKIITKIAKKMSTPALILTILTFIGIYVTAVIYAGTRIYDMYQAEQYAKATFWLVVVGFIFFNDKTCNCNEK